jgi:membrane fusion protein (multidrug efflux system)
MLRRRMLIMLGVVLLIVLILGGYKAFSIYTMIQGFASQTADQRRRGHGYRTAVAGACPPSAPQGLQGVELSLEVAGTVVELHFESGRRSRPGNPAATRQRRRNRPARNRPGRPRAGQLDFGRGSQLVGSRAISKGEYDRLSAVLQKSKASVNQLKAALAKKHRRAVQRHHRHSSGRRRRLPRQRHHDRHPAGPQQPLRRLRARAVRAENAIGQPVKSGRGLPGQTFPGTISAINPKLENSTRNMLVRATLANPDGKLLPGCSPACR